MLPLRSRTKLNEMKAFFSTPSIFFRLLCWSAGGICLGISAQADQEPLVAGPLTPLRKAPVFESETVYLSKNWGPAIPMDRPFRVEKVYGRWLFGTPEPLPRMQASEYAAPGWVFSRFLLKPGDTDTASKKIRAEVQAILYHSGKIWELLGLAKDPQLLAWNFYENLVLSKGALQQFQQQDQTNAELENTPSLNYSSNYFSFLPISAIANAEPGSESVGLTGTDLSFLDQEFKVVQQKKIEQKKQVEARKLKPPGSPTLTEQVKLALLGRYIASQHLVLPPLNHEEVDGFFYLKAVAKRALQGCPQKVQKYWQDRHWNFFRFYRTKNSPVAHPWQEVTLPGGYFGVSAKAIDLAGDESELAFLLARQLVRESRLKFPKVKFPAKDWWRLLSEKSEDIFAARLKAQSGKFSDNLDVSDEIQIDLIAAECLAKSGYQAQSAHVFLRKMFLQREERWSQWFFQQAIGFEYRTEQVGERLKKEMELQKWNPDGVRNQKRFASVAKQWNLMP